MAQFNNKWTLNGDCNFFRFPFSFLSKDSNSSTSNSRSITYSSRSRSINKQHNLPFFKRFKLHSGFVCLDFTKHIPHFNLLDPEERNRSDQLNLPEISNPYFGTIFSYYSFIECVILLLQLQLRMLHDKEIWMTP